MQQSGMEISDSSEDREQEEIEQKLIEALQSPPVPLGKDFWKEIRRIAHARALSGKPVAPS
jgi:hypothetical protein